MVCNHPLLLGGLSVNALGVVNSIQLPSQSERYALLQEVGTR